MTQDLAIRRPRVLYVDDQPGNLLVFKASFKKHVDVVTAASANEGLRALETGEFPLVISDQKMEGMSGAELLGEIRRRWPDTIRMLMTAYTNFDDVVAAINDGQVSRFVSKPWEPQDLLAAIVNACELYWKTKENRALSERLLHRERLAAIGQVTSGLVHELGNVAAVLTVAQDIKEQWKGGDDISRELDILQGGIDKFLVLVESLRVYSKGGDQLQLVMQPVDLGALVQSTLIVLRLFPQVRGLQQLLFEPPPAAVMISGDAKKIQQVLVNVIKNAAESCSPGSGVVTVAVEASTDRIHVHIGDNGPGISAAAAERVWEGFYSTKGDKGTGLGLVMCRKIMAAHGGEIAFVNGSGGGCVFTLSLPRA